jgi:hypothetical protein
MASVVSGDYVRNPKLASSEHGGMIRMAAHGPPLQTRGDDPEQAAPQFQFN